MSESKLNILSGTLWSMLPLDAQGRLFTTHSFKSVSIGARFPACVFDLLPYQSPTVLKLKVV
jgi:hypothetical protein